MRYRPHWARAVGTRSKIQGDRRGPCDRTNSATRMRMPILFDWCVLPDHPRVVCLVGTALVSAAIRDATRRIRSRAIERGLSSTDRAAKPVTALDNPAPYHLLDLATSPRRDSMRHPRWLARIPDSRSRAVGRRLSRGQIVSRRLGLWRESIVRTRTNCRLLLTLTSGFTPISDAILFSN
jgi:hypothetical protein